MERELERELKPLILVLEKKENEVLGTHRFEHLDDLFFKLLVKTKQALAKHQC